MHAEELWKSPKLGPQLARLALTPLSWLYAAGWQVYLGLYRLGIKRGKKPHTPIICVGNLTTGGSGKSPVTLHLADLLTELGYSVVVGASGYGSPRAEAASVAPEGGLDPAEWGDEPAMFRWLRPDVPLIVGRRRVLAAELCNRDFRGAVLLMDDGFQHLPLAKDVSIVLDPASPVNVHCLPAGPYREPRGNRRRASLVLPGQFEVVASPLRFVSPDGTEAQVSGTVQALCALGNPEGFRDSLTESGLQVSAFKKRPDHDRLDDSGVWDEFEPEKPIVVTSKDWVKLRKRPDIGNRRVVIAMRDVRIEPAAEFRAWLSQSLHETLSPSSQ